MRFIFPLLALALAAQCVNYTVRAEEPATPPKPAVTAPAPNPAPGAGDNNNNGGRGGRTRGNWGGNMGGGMPGGIGAMLGGAGRGLDVSVVTRMAGIEYRDPTAAPKVEQLPLGANLRSVTEIPVGGVDNFDAPGKGWKVENVFTLTADQTKAIDDLRTQYDAEQKKLGEDIAKQEKELADKVIQLRAAYEKKANDVLSANDKAVKEKMDALSNDVATRNQKDVADTVPLYDAKDTAQMFTMIRQLRDKIGKNIQDGEDKLQELLPADTKAKLVEALKAQATARERQTQFMNFIGNGGPGGPGGQGGFGGGMRTRGAGGGANDTVKPPRPPETEKF